MDPFVFIVGQGRSGTTLVRAMLTSHPEMAIPPETHFIVPLSRDKIVLPASGRVSPESMVERLVGNPGFKRMELSGDEVRAALTAGGPRDYPSAIREVFRLYAQKAGKSRYGDKSPGQALHLETLATMFPEAVFIHVIRDGRNVLLSSLETSFGPVDVVEGAVVWRRLVKEGRSAGFSLGSDRYCEVRYEDLLNDPEREIRRLSAFVRLDYHEAMLRYFERTDHLGVNGPHHRNLSLPPTKGLRDWRRQMTSRQRAIFESLAGDLLGELGYERTAAHLRVQDRAHLGAKWLSFQGRRMRSRLKEGAYRVRRRARTPLGTRS